MTERPQRPQLPPQPSCYEPTLPRVQNWFTWCPFKPFVQSRALLACVDCPYG